MLGLADAAGAALSNGTEATVSVLNYNEGAPQLQGDSTVIHSNRPQVHYKKEVSDPWLKRFLQTVALVVGGDVTVHSGDRNFVPQGGSNTSPHLKGRAADLKVSGFTPKQVFDRLLAAADTLPAPMMGRYQVLYHGKHTATEAEHVHVGRYSFLDQKKSQRAGFDFWTEGITPETAGKYTPVGSVDLGDGTAAPFR